MFEMLKRYLIFIIGLFVSSIGIALTTKAGLGTSPISSAPYVLSFIFPMSFGQFTVIVNVFLIFLQILVLKKDFQKIQLLQVVVSLLLGSFIDFFMYIFSNLSTPNYFSQFVYLLLGCVFIALGVSLQVIANVIMLSGEALVKAISTKLDKNFGTIKTIFDVSLVTISVIISLAGLGNVVGLREGTVIAALIVGSIARFFISKLDFINNFFESSLPEEC
jgi:Predicted membrane protein